MFFSLWQLGIFCFVFDSAYHEYFSFFILWKMFFLMVSLCFLYVVFWNWEFCFVFTGDILKEEILEYDDWWNIENNEGERLQYLQGFKSGMLKEWWSYWNKLAFL